MDNSIRDSATPISHIDGTQRLWRRRFSFRSAAVTAVLVHAGMVTIALATPTFAAVPQERYALMQPGSAPILYLAQATDNSAYGRALEEQRRKDPPPKVLAPPGGFPWASTAGTTANTPQNVTGGGAAATAPVKDTRDSERK